MRFGSIFLAVAAFAVAVFLFVNWPVFAAPATFRLFFATFQVPIGAAMLAVLGLIVLAFAVFVAIWRSTVLLDYRRQSKELQSQRKLADDAEASRFTELSTLLRGEVSALGARLETAIETVRAEVRDTEHSIAATLAEMDDRMRRTGGA